MKNNFLVIGLGNPGDQYKNTRHNIGYLVLDFIHKKFEIKKRNYLYYKLSERFFINKTSKVKAYFMYPLTFMNNSGEALKNFFKNNNPEEFDLIVIHDDLDMDLGKIKIKKKSGHGGHNGIKSIINELGTNEFKRIKIGIGRPKNKNLIPEYVLSDFSLQEIKVINKSILKAANLTINMFFYPIEKVQNFILN